MKDRINTYFAVLILTIAGAGATLLIVHVATENSFSAIINGNNANYYAAME